MIVLNAAKGSRKPPDFSLTDRKFSFVAAVGYIVASALLLRLVIACCYLNSYDTEWNIMWAVQLGDGFFSAHIHVTDLDYPPLYFYPLYIVGRLIGIPEIGGYPPFRMLAIKFVPCLCDSLSCAVVYRLASGRSKKLALFAAAAWALNPALIFNCACWGQTDCVLLFMALLLMAALGQKRLVASGVLWAAMCSTKLQGLYLTPVVGMEVLTICFGSLYFRDFSLKSINKPAVRKFAGFVVAAAATLAAVYLPFMLGSAFSGWDTDMGFWERFFKPVTVYSEGLAKYPYASMNADNLYMLAGLNGAKDSRSIIGPVSVSVMGKFFLLAAVLTVVASYVFCRRRSHWLSAYIFMESVFILTSRQHERYQIIVLALLIGAAVKIADRRLLTLFSLNTLVIFFNQFRVLSGVQEKTGWWHYYRRVNPFMRGCMDDYIYNGAGWLADRRIYSGLNSLLNVCLFAASAVFAARFMLDEGWDKPVIRRLAQMIKNRRESARTGSEV